MQIRLSETESIFALSTPFSLRLNRLAGMFATGNLDLTDPLSVAAYGRGKALTIAPISITTKLFGTIGKSEDREWAHVLGVIISAEHPSLPRGLVIDFLCCGYEIEVLKSFNVDAEIAAILGQTATPKLIDIKFDKQVLTQYGSTIKPPTIRILDCPKDDLDLAKAALNLWDSHPEIAVDPTQRHPSLTFALNQTTPALAAAKEEIGF